MRASNVNNTIWDVLDYGYIVYSNEKRGIAITFNGSETFNVWVFVQGNASDWWRNIDCFTNNGAAFKRMSELVGICESWLADEEAGDKMANEIDSTEGMEG